mmetsp:Transcript_17528/g.37889  ORF Transcript_17528/g.37889 Transcript_17528/m.37889 type:complete len:292 (-) Transcript_17528:213-1088(-)
MTRGGWRPVRGGGRRAASGGGPVVAVARPRTQSLLGFLLFFPSVRSAGQSHLPVARLWFRCLRSRCQRLVLVPARSNPSTSRAFPSICPSFSIYRRRFPSACPHICSLTVRILSDHRGLHLQVILPEFRRRVFVIAAFHTRSRLRFRHQSFPSNPRTPVLPPGCRRLDPRLRSPKVEFPAPRTSRPRCCSPRRPRARFPLPRSNPAGASNRRGSVRRRHRSLPRTTDPVRTGRRNCPRPCRWRGADRSSVAGERRYRHRCRPLLHRREESRRPIRRCRFAPDLRCLPAPGA